MFSLPSWINFIEDLYDNPHNRKEKVQNSAQLHSRSGLIVAYANIIGNHTQGHQCGQINMVSYISKAMVSTGS